MTDWQTIFTSLKELNKNIIVENEKAEEDVINELKQIDKPFVVVINSKEPRSEKALKLKEELEEKYDVTAVVMSVENMSKEDATNVLQA